MLQTTSAQDGCKYSTLLLAEKLKVISFSNYYVLWCESHPVKNSRQAPIAQTFSVTSG